MDGRRRSLAVGMLAAATAAFGPACVALAVAADAPATTRSAVAATREGTPATRDATPATREVAASRPTILTTALKPAVVTTPQIEALLADLSGGEWRKRDAAVAELGKLGEPALPRVEEFARTTRDDEARCRATTLLSRRPGAGRFQGPTRVTLKLSAATPQNAFDELSRQAGIPIRPIRQSLWSDGDFPPVTLSLKEAPFWSAVREVCRLEGLKPMYQGGGDEGVPPQLVLVPDQTGDMTGPHVVAGPALVALSSLRVRRSFAAAADAAKTADAELTLAFYLDPKWQVFSYPAAADIDFAAANGTALPKSDRLSMLPHKDASPVWSMRGAIKGVPAGATQIGPLRGSFKIAMLDQTPPAEIKDVMRGVNAVSRSGPHSLQLADISRAGEGYQVRVILTRVGLTPREWRTKMEADGVQLFDGAGRPMIRMGGYDAQEYGSQVAFNLQFRPDTPQAAGAEGRPIPIPVKGARPAAVRVPPVAAAAVANPESALPSRLIWRIPLEPCEMTVPFAFESLPLER